MEIKSATTNVKKAKRIPFHHARTTICCSGHVVTSSDYLWLLLTAAAILLPLTAYTALQAERVHFVLGWWWNVLIAVSFVAVVVFAGLGAFNDPGILPRYTSPRDTLESSFDTKNGKETLVYHELNPQFLLGKDVKEVDGTVSFWKYCNTCELFRPPRCSHCSRCDNCVEEFDHHCPWLSNCIGRRNYRWFVLFVASVALLATLVAVSVSLLVWKEAQILRVVIYKIIRPHDLLLFLYALFVALCLLYMTGYHLNAIRLNKTTSEQIKSSRGRVMSDAPNPGFLSNCNRIFCHPIPARQVDWRQYRNSPA